MDSMVRRRSPPPFPTAIPEGWTRHDGAGCPVDRDSRPAVMFRSGSRMQPGLRKAEEWQSFGGSDLWNWNEEPERFDIVAYRPED